MDAVSLLLIFLFFILPIIQRVIEHSRRNTPGQAPGEEVEEGGVEWEELTVRQEPAAPGRVGPAAEEQTDNWSGGWGSWPEPTVTEPEMVDEPALPPRVEAVPVEVIPPRSEVAVRQATAGARTAPERRSGQLEPLADLARMEPSRRTSRALQSNPGLEGVKPASRGSRLPLRSTKELRQAIVLGEVLGPPLSIRRTVERE